MSQDVIVVGAGIVGLATAYRAHKLGLSVHVIDAADRPAGSSLLNFGHACITAQADEALPMALESRAGWLEAADDTGLWARKSGTWIPATTDLEMQLLREFHQHRGDEQVRLVGAEEIARGIGNPGLQALGGAHLPLDLRVNPREAAPRLAEWLSANGVRFTWNTQVTGVGEGTVHTVRGQFSAERVVVCPGDRLMNLFPEIAEKYGVRVCTLAMSMISRPHRVPDDLGMLTGTSLARYDGFTAMPSVAELRDELAAREPELVKVIANLMVTAVGDGLLIGDSHDYDLSPLPFIDEDTGSLLLGKATDVLGIENPQVLQRWQGHYADSPQTNLISENIDDNTVVVVVTSGIGMTMSFGVAQHVLRQLNVAGV